MKKRLLLVVSVVMAACLVYPAAALKTDRNQPATLDADEFDLDFQTGVRTYRGNVIYQQGTIRLYADELVAYIKDDKLERAVARGNPAKFSQRPDDSETDVVGVALRIELDDVKQIVILQDRAKVTQDANTITGKRIEYDMVKEKVKVRSGKQAGPTAAKSNPEGQPEDSTKQEAGEPVEPTATSRPRLIIKPRN